MKPAGNKTRLREWHFFTVMGVAVFIMAVALYWQERAALPDWSACPLCGQEVAP